MGIYLPDPERLESIGRLLNGSFTLSGLTRQLQADEVVVGKYYNGAYYLYPILSTEIEFRNHESQSISSCYYAVKIIDV